MNITLNVSGTQPSVKLADEAAARDLTSLLPSPSRCNFQASNASLTSRRLTTRKCARRCRGSTWRHRLLLVRRVSTLLGGDEVERGRRGWTLVGYLGHIEARTPWKGTVRLESVH